MKMEVVSAIVMVLWALTAIPDLAAANVNVPGRKFTIQNVFPFNGIPPCSDANPNTVAFYPGKSGPLSGTVVIVGEFDAANIGVCANSFYAIPPGTTIQYYIYGDWILFHVSGYVGSALKVVLQQGQIYTIGLAQNNYVSILTDVGKA